MAFVLDMNVDDPMDKAVIKKRLDTWLASEFDPKGPSAGNVEAINRLDAGRA